MKINQTKEIQKSFSNEVYNIPECNQDKNELIKIYENKISQINEKHKKEIKQKSLTIENLKNRILKRENDIHNRLKHILTKIENENIIEENKKRIIMKNNEKNINKYTLSENSVKNIKINEYIEFLKNIIHQKDKEYLELNLIWQNFCQEKFNKSNDVNKNFWYVKLFFNIFE